MLSDVHLAGPACGMIGIRRLTFTGMLRARASKIIYSCDAVIAWHDGP